jgi:hypothetical protein
MNQNMRAGNCSELLTRCFRNKIDSERLSAAIASVKERLEAYRGREPESANDWWANSAGRLLDTAAFALSENEIDKGWSAVQEADCALIYGMHDGELLARAVSLESEVGKKLKGGWRGKAVDEMFGAVTLKEWLKAPAKLTDEQRRLLQQVVVEALALLHDDSRNTYHRIRIVRNQLTYLVVICAAMLLFALGLSAWLAWDSPEFGPGILMAVATAGALGGVVSGMYQLSRVGSAKIPEALIHGLVTSGRPLVGAASALFIYAVMKSGIVGLIDKKQVSLLAGLALGFAAGLSERFVLLTVAKVTGSEDDAKADGGKEPKPPKGQKEGPKTPTTAAPPPQPAADPSN